MRTIWLVLAKGAALVLAAGFILGSAFVSQAQMQAQFASARANSVVSKLAETHGLKLADEWNRFGTYWYLLEGKFLVPLPGAPLDSNLRIYSLGDGTSYLVDENTPPTSGVNNARLEVELNWLQGVIAQALEARLNAELDMMLGIAGEITPMDAGAASPNQPQFADDILHVESLTRSNGFLIFNIQGLISGNTFLLARKTVLNNDFRNYWVPQWSFVATNTNQIVSIPFPTNSDTGFYLVVDYDLYQGPAPTIVAPTDNSTGSGIVHLECSLTDIFPAAQAELFVDEKSFGIVTNGHAGWDVDTALLPNGSHSVDVQFLSLIPVIDINGFNNLEYWRSDALLNLITDNFLAENIAPRNFTAEFGTVPFAFDTSDHARIDVHVYDATGTNLVWNTSVTNDSAVTGYPYWNLTDNQGNPVALPGTDQTVTYKIVVRATPLNNGSMAPAGGSNPTPNNADDWSERVFNTNIGTDAHAGRTAVFYDLYGALAPAGINENIENLLSGTMGAVLVAHIVHPSDMDGWDRGLNSVAMPYIFASNSDFPYFFTILTNQLTGQFQYVCGSNGDDFGAESQNTASYVFSGGEVANKFGTYINDNAMVGDKYGHRVRMANIEACNSASGGLNRVFGSPNGMDHNPGMSKSSFVGWSIYVVLTGSYLPNTVCDLQIKYWHNYWAEGGFFGGPGIQHANARCMADIGAIYDIQIGRRVQGSKGMTWIKND